MAHRRWTIAALALSIALGPMFGCAARPPTVRPELQTVAESSGFKATARYDEVFALLRRMAAASPLVRLGTLGTTVEGRAIPLAIVADPPVAAPDDAALAARDDGKLIVLMIGNIHAGEVDGKEALPLLMRELITTPRHPLLRDLVLLFAPIYNCDGNERVARDHRPGQVGPEEGMGVRENAQGFDLNRDFVKLEAPETRGLVDTLTRWRPDIFIDTHTTNGSFHRYIITYAGPKTPAGDDGLIRYCRDELLPGIQRAMRVNYRRASFVYGDFNREHTRWETYPSLARYGTSYVGLRGRISILSEGYSYASYEERVLGTRDFVKACLEYAAANKRRIRSLLAEVDARTIERGRNPRPEDLVTLRSRARPAPERALAAGYVEAQRDGRTYSTGVPKDYLVELWTHYESTLSVPRPFAYLVPPDLAGVHDNLVRHGVAVERLARDVLVEVEAYHIDGVTRANQAFQGRFLATVEATPRRERRVVRAGTWVVRTGQPLGNLAAYLLEPECEDGLTTWGFLDGRLRAGEEFPILRVPRATELPTELNPH